MTLDVSRCSAVIVVFAMDGCGACEDYKPRLEREIARWQASGAPLVFCETANATFVAPQVPVILLDAQSSDEQIQGWADQFDVEGLPTTVLFRRNAQPLKIEGAIDNAKIYDLLAQATRA